MWAVVLTIDKSKFGCTRFVCKQAFTRSFVQTFGTCFAHKSQLRLRHSSVTSCLAAHYWSQCLGVARLAALKHVPRFFLRIAR